MTSTRQVHLYRIRMAKYEPQAWGGWEASCKVEREEITFTLTLENKQLYTI